METETALLGGSVNKTQNAFKAGHFIPMSMSAYPQRLRRFPVPHTCFCFNHCFDHKEPRAWTLLIDKSAGNDAKPGHDIHYRSHGATKLLVYMSAATHSGKKVESLELYLKWEAANFVAKLRTMWALLIPGFMNRDGYLVISQLSRIPYRTQGNKLLLWSVGKYPPISRYALSERAKSQKQKGKTPPSQLPVRLDQGLHTTSFCLVCCSQCSGVQPDTRACGRRCVCRDGVARSV